MKEFTREIAYNQNIVFLLCDFYNDKYIPSRMYNVTDNLALFPVNNYPLIDYILQNLIEQNFMHVVLVGNKIESVIRHVMTGKFDILMNISYLSNDNIFGNVKYTYILDNIGQFFKTLLHYNLTNDFLIYHANQYTTFNITLLKAFHEMNKAISTFYIFETSTNAPEFYTYEFLSTGKLINIKKNNEKSCNISHKWNSPGIAYCSPLICQVFNEVSDARDLTQLIDELKDILAFDRFQFNCLNTEIINTIKSIDNKLTSQDTIEDFFVTNYSFSYKTIEQILEYENNLIYLHGTRYINKEIITLMDYINFCKDIKPIKDELLSNERIQKVIKNFDKDTSDNNINEFESSNFKVTTYKPEFQIIFSPVKEEYFIEFGTGELINCCTVELDVVNIIETNVDENKLEKESFFDEVLTYLKHKFVNKDTDIESILKNINLFKIFWNTSTEETLEVYIMFFMELIQEYIHKKKEKREFSNWEEIENIICDTTNYFCLIQNELNKNEELEFYFMEMLFELCKDIVDDEFNNQVLYSYCYLFKACNIIKPHIIKLYRKKIKKL